MSDYLEYKGYYGTIEPQVEHGTLYGKIGFIRDLVTFEAATLPTLEKEFKKSVDEYLKDCKALGKAPDKPFKGSFNVRVSPELHRQAALAVHGKNLNAFVAEAIKEKIERIAQQR
jgi:predicted HicB family RNase H-like nuclease